MVEVEMPVKADFKSLATSILSVSLWAIDHLEENGQDANSWGQVV